MDDNADDDFDEIVADLVAGRCLHSLTSQLNLSAFYGIGGARRDGVARVMGVLADV